MFAFVLLMNHVRNPAIMMINVAGAFAETQKGALIEAAINLSVSLILFFFTPLGLYGLLLGTVCSYLFRTFDVQLFVYRNILYRSIRGFLKFFTVNLTLMMIVYFVTTDWLIIYVNSLLDWIGLSIIASFMVAVLFVFANYITNKKQMQEVLGFCRDRIRQRKAKTKG